MSRKSSGQSSYFLWAESKIKGTKYLDPNGRIATAIGIIQTDGWRNPEQDFDYKIKLDNGEVFHWSELKEATLRFVPDNPTDTHVSVPIELLNQMILSSSEKLREKIREQCCIGGSVKKTFRLGE